VKLGDSPTHADLAALATALTGKMTSNSALRKAKQRRP
jgi:hypothetical protein